jgi:hypothetical protein
MPRKQFENLATDFCNLRSIDIETRLRHERIPFRTVSKPGRKSRRAFCIAPTSGIGVARQMSLPAFFRGFCMFARPYLQGSSGAPVWSAPWREIVSS